MLVASALRSALTATILAALAAAAGTGCASSVEEDEEVGIDEGELSSQNKRATWVYQGPLPTLESPEIVISMTAHTLRVTGYLPDGFDRSKIPFYALPQDEGGRTRIHVVYPVASGKPGTPRPNKSYDEVFINPHHITQGYFGGFPFIGYSGLLGMHGPIDADGSSWVLNRGMVSSGCNRMLGEHVTELAHLVGMDMSQPKASFADRPTWPRFDTPLRLQHVPDVIGGVAFDVDYPVARDKGVQLPQVGGDITRVIKFPTWYSQEYPASVCAYRAGDAKPIAADYCARKVGPNNDRALYAPFAEVTTPTVVRGMVGSH